MKCSLYSVIWDLVLEEECALVCPLLQNKCIWFWLIWFITLSGLFQIMVILWCLTWMKNMLCHCRDKILCFLFLLNYYFLASFISQTLKICIYVYFKKEISNDIGRVWYEGKNVLSRKVFSLKIFFVKNKWFSYWYCVWYV